MKFYGGIDYDKDYEDYKSVEALGAVNPFENHGNDGEDVQREGEGNYVLQFLTGLAHNGMIAY